MGGYSDSSDEDRKRKKKKKKRSPSRSREGSMESSVSSRRSAKHKSKKKKRQRSRSRSPKVKHRRRSLSRSRSRSPSRRVYDRRSRSKSYDKYRSRSHERRSKRSRSRDRRSKSRRRSYSRERRSRSGSNSRKRGRHSRSSSYDSRHGEGKKDKDDPCANVPGFSEMTPSEQAKIRMQLALKAAAAADEKLKEQGVLLNPKATMSAGEQKKFNKALEKIERESFAPTAFFSSKEKPTAKPEDEQGRSNLERSHDNAIFGSAKLDIKLDPSERTTIVYTGATSLAHPNLHKTAKEKMGRWIEKLTNLRKRKLEGEIML